MAPIQAAGGNFNVYDIRKPCIGARMVTLQLRWKVLFTVLIGGPCGHGTLAFAVAHCCCPFPIFSALPRQPCRGAPC